MFIKILLFRKVRFKLPFKKYLGKGKRKSRSIVRIAVDPT